MNDDNEVCVKCGRGCTIDEWEYDGDDYYCEQCFEAETKIAEQAAQDEAIEKCEIAELPPFNDESREWWDEWGSEESYYATCRHECSNYDSLIRDLRRDCPWDRLRYGAIHERVMSLIYAHVESQQNLSTL